MRHVALFIILLISFYFLFVKPLLTHKGVVYHIEGLSFNLNPVGLKVKEILISLPSYKGGFFLNLRNIHLRLEKTLKVYLKEGYLLIKGSSSESKRNISQATIPSFPSFLKSANIKVDFFLFAQSDKDLLLIFENTQLIEGKLKGKLLVHSKGEDLTVHVKDIRLKEKSVEIRDLIASSELFEFSIKGALKEGNLKGMFLIKGKVKTVETNQIKIYPVEIKGKGILTYKKFTADLEAFTEKAILKSRKEFGPLFLKGKLNFEFGKALLLEGYLEGETLKSNYKLSLLPKKKLKLWIDELLLDNKILGLEQPAFSWLRAEVTLNFDNKQLYLFAETEGINSSLINTGKTQIVLSYNYATASGKVDFLVAQPFYTQLSGYVREKSFKAKFLIEDFILIDRGISLFLSYKGDLFYRRTPGLSGSGEIRDVFLRDIYIGDINYKVSLRGDKLNLILKGDGFSGFVKGSLRKNLFSELKIRKVKRKIKDFYLEISEGFLKVEKLRDKTDVTVNIEDVFLKEKKISIRASLKADLSQREELKGTTAVILKGGVFYGYPFQKVALKGNIKEGIFKGDYWLDNILKGTAVFHLQKIKMETKGVFKKEPFTLLYSFEGDKTRGSLLFKASAKTFSEVFSIKGLAEYRNGRYRLKVNPTNWQYGTVKVAFAGMELKGDFKRGTVNFEPLRVYLMEREAITIKQKEGKFSLEKKMFKLSLSVEGAVKGSVNLLSEPKKGFSLYSKGFIDLENLSFFTATPLGGKAQGALNYTVSYRSGLFKFQLSNKNRVVAFSRYLSLPVEAFLNFKMINKNLAAFITLWHENAGLSMNMGSLNLRDWYIYAISRDLPLFYRDKNLAAYIKLTSESWISATDYKKIKVKTDALLEGELDITKIFFERKQGKGRKETKMELELDVRFDSPKPIRVRLPEGYLYAHVRGWIEGPYKSPDYSINVELISGELNYFGRRFILKGGTFTVIREAGLEEKLIDISMVNPEKDLSIFIELKGNLENPNLFVWSEPPISTQEILTRLIIGSTAEGIIPVAQTLLKQLGYIGKARSGLADLLGVEMSLSTQTSSRGELGINLNIKKRISKIFSIEYQQSTLGDPRATYYGGSVNLPSSFSFYGRIFSDNSSEIKLRVIKKFDF